MLVHEGRLGDVNIAIVTDEQIRRMNRDFRNVDASTDVLSFPAWDGTLIESAAYGFLGDIAINRAAAFRQAAEYGHSPERELSFLAVHGVLHLLGYDHINPEDEPIMNKKQEEILAWIGMIR